MRYQSVLVMMGYLLHFCLSCFFLYLAMRYKSVLLVLACSRDVSSKFSHAVYVSVSDAIGRTPNIANHFLRHLNNTYWLKLVFLLLFNSLTCPAISRYNFCLKIILAWEILSLLYIPIFSNCVYTKVLFFCFFLVFSHAV